MVGMLDWVRYVVAPVVLGLVSAAIATRNARKTPHERLKNLVDIAKNMPEGVDPDGTVIRAVARELVDFDRRLKADQTSLRARWREWFVQNPGRATSRLVAVGVLFMGLFVTIAANSQGLSRPLQEDHPVRAAVMLGAGILGLGSLFIAVVLSSRQSHLGLERIREQRAAEISAVESHEEARLVLTDDQIDELQELTRELIGDGLSSNDIKSARRARINEWTVERNHQAARNRAAHGAPPGDSA